MFVQHSTKITNTQQNLNSTTIHVAPKLKRRNSATSDKTETETHQIGSGARQPYQLRGPLSSLLNYSTRGPPICCQSKMAKWLFINRLSALALSLDVAWELSRQRRPASPVLHSCSSSKTPSQHRPAPHCKATQACTMPDPASILYHNASTK